MKGSHGGELFSFRMEERGLGWIGKELHNRIVAHTEATFLKEVIQTSQCLWKIEPTHGWCGRIAFWQVWQEFSQHFFTCLFSPSMSQPWLLSLDSVPSPVSSWPCILPTNAASLTWIKTWGKGSQRAPAFSDQSRIFSQGKKSTCTHTFSYNFKTSWNPC